MAQPTKSEMQLLIAIYRAKVKPISTAALTKLVGKSPQRVRQLASTLVFPHKCLEKTSVGIQALYSLTPYGRTLTERALEEADEKTTQGPQKAGL